MCRLWSVSDRGFTKWLSWGACQGAVDGSQGCMFQVTDVDGVHEVWTVSMAGHWVRHPGMGVGGDEDQGLSPGTRH